VRDKELLVIDKKRDFPEKIPSGGGAGSPVEQLIPLLLFFDELTIR
jgi:hypothetical protein